MFLTCANLQNYKLGNAMFIYAALRSITSLKGYELKLPAGTKLDVFANLKYEQLTQQDANNLKYMYAEPSFSFNKMAMNLPPYGTTEAYFQCEKYFINIKEELLKEFVLPAENLNNVVSGLLDKTTEYDNRIAVHVRRGDYVNYVDYHPMLPVSYYLQAEKVFEHLNNKIFVVCSDSIDWCKENLKFTSGKVIYSEGLSDVEDLFLMRYCDHNIIANSSFSWWSAWLNENPDKIVVGPQTRNPQTQQWFAHKGPQDTQDLLPESWITI